MVQERMGHMEFQVSLKIILKNKKGEILLLKAPVESSMAGYYDFPGGRINENEAKAPFGKIINREICEEIGKEVRYSIKETPVAVGRHFYFSKRENKEKHIVWIFFEAQYKRGQIEVSPEHKEYAWVKITKLNYKKYFVKGALDGAHNYLFKKF